MSIEIHYCVKCKWMMRSAWMAQEILATFEDHVESVALWPSHEAGTFQIKINGTIVWDRRVDGGFPQPKELKQKVRDVLVPGKNIGHNEATKTSVPPPQPLPVPRANSQQSQVAQDGCDFGSPKLNAKHHTFCEECIEQLPPTWEQ